MAKIDCGIACIILNRERDVGLWKKHSLMVQWVIGSILLGGHIGLFLIPASAPRLV